METTAKQKILDEILKLSERVETLKSALAVIQEFESNTSTKTISKFIEPPKTISPIISLRTTSNDSTFIFDILRLSKEPIPTSEIRRLYAQKVNKPEEEVQQFVDSTLYKSTKLDKGIIKVKSSSNKHTLYTLKEMK